MSFLDRMHGEFVHNRRTEVLAKHFVSLLPEGARVLDVGCGDGLLASRIQSMRPDVEIMGVDVLVREQTHIPVTAFDGVTLPFASASFDVVMLVDVLHHTDDPLVLLREAARVACQCILLKDHTRNGLLAKPTLRFMDWVGNARHGVRLPYNYWPQKSWLDAFTRLGLTLQAWKRDIGLYPVSVNWLFGRSLHFIARLDVSA